MPSNQNLIAVTGGGGYVGCVLVEHLLEKGFAVRVLDTFFWQDLQRRPKHEHLELVRRDIRDLHSDDLRGVRTVVHLAGLSNDPMADFNPEANWDINVHGTQKVADASASAGVERVILGSSASVYDGLDPDTEHDETTPTQPQGPYSRSKYAAEAIILSLENNGISPTVLRQGTVYGYSSRMRFDLVVNAFVKSALLTGILNLHMPGTNWRPLVDVNDVAGAHIACIQAPMECVRGEIFNVLHDNFRVVDVAERVRSSLAKAGLPVAITEVPGPTRVRDYRCSRTKLTQHLKFRPETTIEEAVQTIFSEFNHIPPAELLHPRFHNIEWMTILDSVATQVRNTGRVF